MSLPGIAHSEEEACKITEGLKLPCLVIPWGMGNIPCAEFICYNESDIRTLWEKYMADVKTPTFRRVHVLRAHGWSTTRPLTSNPSHTLTPDPE